MFRLRNQTKKEGPKGLGARGGTTLCCAALAGIIIFTFISSKSAIRVSGKEIIELGDSYVTQIQDLTEETVVEQSFVPEKSMQGFYLRFVTYALHISGTMRVQLIDTADNCILYDEIESLEEVKDVEPTVFRLANPVEPKGQRLKIRISEVQLAEGSRMSITCAPTDVYAQGKFWLDGVEQPTDLGFGIFSKETAIFDLPFLLIGGVFLAISGTAVALCFYNRAKPELLFLFLALAAGVALLFVQTPLYGFDIIYHYDSAYSISSQMLGKQDWVFHKDAEGNGSYLRRACDDLQDLPLYYPDNVFSAYQIVKEELTDTVTEEEAQPVVQEEASHGGPGYMYLPQAAGFAAARLLGLGRIGLLMLGRVVNYLFYLAMVFFAIKIVPQYKLLFLTVGLLPASLLTAISLSRDTFILGICLLYTAKCLNIGLVDRKLRPGDFVLVTLLMLLLAPCKLVYLPMVLLLVWAIFKHAGGVNKQSVLLAISLVAIIGIFFMLMSLGTLSTVVAKKDALSIFGQSSYVFSDALHRPFFFLLLCVNTLVQRFGELFANAIALYEIKLGLTTGITLAFGAMLLASVLPVEYRPEIRIEMRDKIWFGLALLGVLGLALLAAFQWTSIGSQTIRGMQGRYFTPVLPLVLLLFSGNQVVVLKKDPAKGIVLGCLFTNLLMISNMYLWTITK